MFKHITPEDVGISVCIALIAAILIVAALDMFFAMLPQARVCGWCREVMTGGHLPATHGMCATCYEQAMKEIDDQEKELTQCQSQVGI